MRLEIITSRLMSRKEEMAGRTVVNAPFNSMASGNYGAEFLIQIDVQVIVTS